jgi:hypothetical protein
MEAEWQTAERTPYVEDASKFKSQYEEEDQEVRELIA